MGKTVETAQTTVNLNNVQEVDLLALACYLKTSWKFNGESINLRDAQTFVNKIQGLNEQYNNCPFQLICSIDLEYPEEFGYKYRNKLFLKSLHKNIDILTFNVLSPEKTEVLKNKNLRLHNVSIDVASLCGLCNKIRKEFPTFHFEAQPLRSLEIEISHRTQKIRFAKKEKFPKNSRNLV